MAVTLLVAVAGALLIVAERLRPGRSWPSVPGWWARALVATAVQALVVFVLGSTADAWMGRFRPRSADALGTAGGALAGYLAITFVNYWWHRWRHEVGFLWRWFHQFHHSPQRIEIVTSFYKHPFELAVNGLLSSAILYFGVGLGPAAATAAVAMAGLAELFYHWNVRTPYWLGFLVQRPESHCVHHEEGVHHFNYADLPLWDMLFGTFKNPRAFDGRCGFGPEGEGRVLEMLVGIDVNEPARQEAV